MQMSELLSKIRGIGDKAPKPDSGPDNGNSSASAAGQK
jgi:hypothetical protein